jgi:NAD+ kinase
VRFERIACVHSDTDRAREGYEEVARAVELVAPEDADVIVALGGDGFMLQTLHDNLSRRVPIFGMGRGSVGFLMNDFSADGLRERLEASVPATIFPLHMAAHTSAGGTHEALAINEVSLLRESVQAAHLEISVNGVVRLDRLVCDGVLVATPAGSTAYNLSAHGPVLPLEAKLLALTPISPFRPRRWRGALLPHDAVVEIRVLDKDKRPVAAGADSREVRDVVHVRVREDREHPLQLLFDPSHSLEERIIREQFL